MAITYNAGTDTITVTAGTSGAPNTFTDIYNADVAGGWGQVTKTSNVFVFSAKLQVGDGSTATHLYDEFKKVTLNEIWTVKNNATLKTGVLLAAESNHPRHGCFLVLNTTAANAITIDSGGTFLRYQTPTEDTGAGTNLISNSGTYTEDFYRGVQTIDLKGGMVDNYIGFGLTENKNIARVTESIYPYNGVTYIIRKDPTGGLETAMVNSAGATAGAFSDWEPGIGHIVKFNNDCTLIVDNLVDGEYYKVVWSPISVKYRFDIPAGGGGLMRNPPMTGGTV
jgi:hypothetical protein